MFTSVVRLMFLDRSGVLGIDHRIFYNIGRNILAGVSPYSPDRFESHPFLNPPSTFPIFALIAMPSFRVSLVVWTLVNSVLAFSVIWQARRVLSLQDGGELSRLSHAELAALATAFGLSDASMATIQLGQLSLVATALILLALEFQARRRPRAAGVAFGLSLMKVGTVLPFLLVFLRRKDWKSWTALAATVAALILLGGQPTRLFGDLRSMLHYIGELAKPGRVNDISYQGPYCEWILGIDHLAYRLGVRDRMLLSLTQFAVLAVLGAWLAWDIGKQRITRAQAIVLVSLYSVIFLYHRLYDTVMIAPALVYAVEEARRRRGKNHILLVGAVVSMLALLYMRRKSLATLTVWVTSHHGTAASLVEMFVLPYATWLILLSMSLIRAEMADTRTDAPCSPTSTPQHE